MRPWVKAVLLSSAGIGAGFIVGRLSYVGDRVVRVRIRNQSGVSIAAVELIHEHGTAVVQDLAAGKEQCIRFYALGETSYKPIVHFSDGSQIAGEDVYAEAGYEITETVTRTGIEDTTDCTKY